MNEAIFRLFITLTYPPIGAIWGIPLRLFRKGPSFLNGTVDFREACAQQQVDKLSICYTKLTCATYDPSCDHAIFYHRNEKRSRVRVSNSNNADSRDRAYRPLCESLDNLLRRHALVCNRSAPPYDCILSPTVTRIELGFLLLYVSVQHTHCHLVLLFCQRGMSCVHCKAAD